MYDRYSVKYEAMVVPPRQRLTNALSALTLDPNKHLAGAASRLAIAGANLADTASSSRRRFRGAKHCSRSASGSSGRLLGGSVSVAGCG
jgi:hypothetical protein